MNVDMKLFWRKIEELGDMGTIALATCQDGKVTCRPISPMAYEGELLIRTDEDSRKAVQMKANPNVAASLGNDFYLTGTARFIGLCTDEANPEVQKMKAAYAARWPGAFTDADEF